MKKRNFQNIYKRLTSFGPTNNDKQKKRQRNVNESIRMSTSIRQQFTPMKTKKTMMTFKCKNNFGRENVSFSFFFLFSLSSILNKRTKIFTHSIQRVLTTSIFIFDRQQQERGNRTGLNIYSFFFRIFFFVFFVFVFLCY